LIFFAFTTLFRPFSLPFAKRRLSGLGGAVFGWFFGSFFLWFLWVFLVVFCGDFVRFSGGFCGFGWLFLRLGCFVAYLPYF
jgi:hypothetical protein